MEQIQEDAEKVAKILDFPDIDFIKDSLRTFLHLDRNARIQTVIQGFFKEVDSNMESNELSADVQSVKDIFPNVETNNILDMLEEFKGEENRVRLVIRRLLIGKPLVKPQDVNTTSTTLSNIKTKQKKRKRNKSRNVPLAKMYHNLRVKERQLQNLSPMGKILYNKFIHIKKMALKDLNVSRHLIMASKLINSELLKCVMLPVHKDVRAALANLSFLKM